MQRSVCHIEDPDDPNYCDQPAHPGIALVLNASELQALMASNITLEIIAPSWIKYDHIGYSIEIVLGAVDKSKKDLTKLN